MPRAAHTGLASPPETCLARYRFLHKGIPGASMSFDAPAPNRINVTSEYGPEGWGFESLRAHLRAHRITRATPTESAHDSLRWPRPRRGTTQANAVVNA